MKNKFYYVAQAYHAVRTAGSKPGSDFEIVMRHKGFQNLGLKKITTSSIYIWWLWNWISVFIARIRMPKKGIVFLQYPEQRYIAKIVDRVQKRKCQTAFLIHDVNELRGWGKNHPDWLQKAKFVIAHTPAMKDWLEKNYNLNNVIVLGMFDHLLKINSYKNTVLDNTPSIVFAGWIGKSAFLKEAIKNNPDLSFVLFGTGVTDELLTFKNVDYKGSCLPEELPEKISGYNFGLVWDGDEIDRCSGQMGEYVKYNCPYKSASYLASGLPLIVWDKMAIAPFVVENKVGIVVNSLRELTDKIKKITDTEYDALKRNVKLVNEKIITGGFYSDALDEIISKS